MALLDAAFAPAFFHRHIGLPLEKARSRARRRHGPIDAALKDFIGEAVRPGDRTLQIGAGDLVAAAFLERSAFHLLVAPGASVEAVEANCSETGVCADRLRAFDTVKASGNAGQVDAVYIAPSPGFAAMAANWRHGAARLKTGGVLMLDGIDRPDGAKLLAAMNADLGWRLDEVLSGRVAVFRKTAAFQAAD